MIAMIFASEANDGIGLSNDLPWGRQSEDLKNFKKLTDGNTVIMGRNTFESLPPIFFKGNRMIKVITRWNQSAFPENVLVYDKLKDAIDDSFGDIFLMGGSGIYREGQIYADKMYHTRILNSFKCDTFFKPDWSDWELHDANLYQSDDKNENWSVITEYNKKVKK